MILLFEKQKLLLKVRSSFPEMVWKLSKKSLKNICGSKDVGPQNTTSIFKSHKYQSMTPFTNYVLWLLPKMIFF